MTEESLTEELVYWRTKPSERKSWRDTLLEIWALPEVVSADTEGKK